MGTGKHKKSKWPVLHEAERATLMTNLPSATLSRRPAQVDATRSAEVFLQECGLCFFE